MMVFRHASIGPPRTPGRRLIAVLAAGLGMLGVGLVASCNGVEAGEYPRLSKKAARPSASIAPCSQRYPPVATLDFESGLRGEALRERLQGRVAGMDQVWGVEENLESVPGPGGRAELRVFYPEGSINPSADDRPLGGAGFLARMAPQGLERACLRYQVRFEEGFAFKKGGKLPGLYGGEGPSGGDRVAGDKGFSARLMWRKGGEGEVYAYVANKRGKYGASIGRGQWTFEPGETAVIEQEVVLNDPRAANGIVRVWVNGEPVVEQGDLVYRSVPEGRIDGLMFSTFFGGSSSSWKSPRDQHAWFSDFRLYGTPGG